MDRRNFFFSLASFPALFSPLSPTIIRAEEKEPEAIEITDQIRALEEYVTSHPVPFPWDQHNELRHLYGAINEKKSLHHADMILAHSLMDDYMLNILSEWKLGSDDGIAAVNLLTKAEKHPSLLHIKAACLIKVGDLCMVHNREAEAERLYGSVTQLADAARETAPALRQYRMLAQLRLGTAG